MKTMIVYVTTKLVIECEDRTLTSDDIVSDMDYSFEILAAGAQIVDTEILDYTVTKVVDNDS